MDQIKDFPKVLTGILALALILSPNNATQISTATVFAIIYLGFSQYLESKKLTHAEKFQGEFDQLKSRIESMEIGKVMRR